MASITRRPNGRWRARYRDESGTEHARHFTRKVEAQRWLDAVTASLVRGDYVEPRSGKISFDAFFRDWASRQVWAPMTEVQADLVRRSVPFGEVPLADLRPSHLEKWVREMQNHPYAPTTISTRMMTVRACLRAAVRDRRLREDPSVGIDLPRRRRRAQSMEIPTTDQLGRLICSSPPRMRAFIGLCAFAGLRLGEASGLQLSDVDFLRRELNVQRQVQKRRGQPPELRAPKYESERTVYISDELATMLSVHVREHGITSDGWFFTGSSGQPIPPTTVHHWWTRTLHDAQVTGITIHTLRHYYASGLIAAGCDVVTVQRALGHSKPSVTLDTYSHLWPTAEDRTRQASGAMASAALAHADSLRTTGVV